MKRGLALVAALAAAAGLAACGTSSDEGDDQATCTGSTPPGNVAEGSSFIAVERDFRCFRSWSKLELGSGSGTTVHDMGQRVAYVNRKPSAGQKTFPVGTMIVKTTQSEKAPEEWQIFAMVKRGGGFNASGASDWEWFELKIADGTPTLLWRGLGPPVGEGYAQGASCNDCHATAKPNDFVQSPGLALSGFLSAHPFPSPNASSSIFPCDHSW